MYVVPEFHLEMVSQQERVDCISQYKTQNLPPFTFCDTYFFYSFYRRPNDEFVGGLMYDAL